MVTAHWIDSEFCIHEILPGFELLQRCHTGENLACYIFDLLVEFNIQTKLLCVTTDNATNNDTLTASFQTHLATSNFIVFNPSEQHIPCVAHILNLTVQTFLSNLHVIRNDNKDTNTDIDDKDNHHRFPDPEKDFAVTMDKIHEITNV